MDEAGRGVSLGRGSDITTGGEEDDPVNPFITSSPLHLRTILCQHGSLLPG